MKKLIITLTLGIGMMSITSCRWIHETFYSVEGCAEWYLEELYDAAADNDVKEFIERWDQLQQWMNGLSEADQKRADKAYDKWSDENEGKDNYIENWIDKNDIDF